jgi:hypothetical protein
LYFIDGNGSVIQGGDGMYSKSGGLQGQYSRHGDYSRTLSSFDPGRQSSQEEAQRIFSNYIMKRAEKRIEQFMQMRPHRKTTMRNRKGERHVTENDTADKQNN